MKKAIMGYLLFSSSILVSVSVLSEESPVTNNQRTSVSANLVLGDTPIPTLPSGTENGEINNEVSTHFGIAYHPKAFSVKEQLKETGSQSIVLTNPGTNTNHIGVKDTTRSKHQWSLQSSLKWTGNNSGYMDGTSIKICGGEVKENKDGVLTVIENEEVVKNEDIINITSSPIQLMSTNKDTIKNGVYDFGFSKVSLEIPNAGRIAQGNYFAQINWNLSITPENDVVEEQDPNVQQAIEKINSLFNGNELSEYATQETINEAQEVLNRVTSETVKLELQNKLNLAQHLLYKREKHFFKNINVSEKPDNNLKAGILMGSSHDRQDLGIQLKKGAVIKIKQTNPEFKENLSLRLLNDDSHTESSITVSQNEVSLQAKELSVPFIDTPYIQANGAAPKVEFKIEGELIDLPVFDAQTDQNKFADEWNTTGGFAIVKGTRFQTLFPEINRIKVLDKKLLDLISLYDNDIIGYYNKLIGLSDNAADPINKSSMRRYFYKADKHGAGGLYYGKYWAAHSSGSAESWLSDGWGVLHETGHGYQGNFMNRGMDTGEVWNNIYGVIYTYKKLGKEAADRNTWLYDYGKKTKYETKFMNLINQGSMNYKAIGQRDRLIVLSNLIDKAGDDGLPNFYKNYRSIANQPNFSSVNYPLPDLLVKYLGQPNKYDFSAVLSSWGLNVKEDSKQFAKENNYNAVAHLGQVVPDNLLSGAIEKFTKDSRLSSVLSLVTNEELSSMNLRSNVTLHFSDYQLFSETKLKILDGGKLYREIPINQETVTLTDIPNGVYSLELDNNKGYISNPYLFVKDNSVINVSLINYTKEATQAVDNLYQEQDKSKIKPEIMQKDIDEVRKMVNNLPSSDEKNNLLSKLENAFSQLQEITFGGISNRHFATLDVSNSLATIRTNSGVPHNYFSDVYASIEINRGDTQLYKKDFIGTHSLEKKTETIDLQEGDTLTLTHREWTNKKRFFDNHGELINNKDKIVNFRVTEGKLALLN